MRIITEHESFIMEVLFIILMDIIIELIMVLRWVMKIITSVHIITIILIDVVGYVDIGLTDIIIQRIEFAGDKKVVVC